MIRTTKQISAMRQICAAIKHLHAKDYECAITLAAAAEGQTSEEKIPEGARTHLFRVLRKQLESEDVNKLITWLKHPTGEDGAEITQFEVGLTIGRAIQKFVAAYQSSHGDFEDFSQWGVQLKHFPRPITEQAYPLP
jgi:hypothetical protein